MKIRYLLLLVLCNSCMTRQVPLLDQEEMNFLKEITRAVVDSSRILPDQELPPAIRGFGPNRSGITLIRPGGRDCYPSFWIRDYAMSLESGLITAQEQYDILEYTAARQSDSTWKTKNGSMVPEGSIPDHIRISDGLPVYFPGTYDAVYQGSEVWRRPPYCDQFYFIHMAWYYLDETGEQAVLKRNIKGIPITDRLEMAFRAVPVNPANGMAFIDDSLPTCDFGFRDVIGMTGDVCFGSVLRHRAALELADLFSIMGEPGKSERYRLAADTIRRNLIPVFAGGKGLLRASTGRSSQPDVWATAFAVYTGLLDGRAAKEAGRILADSYRNGTLAEAGQIRHVLTTDDFDSTTAWEKSLVPLNTYQNGAFWGTPTGWVCQAMALADREAASALASDFIAHLRKTDFRLGGTGQGGPYECVYPASGYSQNPVYMTTVTCPLAAFLTSIPSSK